MTGNQRVHNPVAVEVVYDSDGHICTGHMSVMADLADPVTSRLVESGRLIVPAPPAQGSEDSGGSADHLIADEVVLHSDPQPLTATLVEAEPAPAISTSTRRKSTSKPTTTSTVSGDNESGETS